MKFLPTQYSLSRCRSSLSPIAAALAIGAVLAAQPADAAIPKARADRVTVGTNESVPIKVTKNDGGLADGPIKVTLISKPGHGWAWVSGKVVGYRSKKGFQGTDKMVYRITDRDGQSSRANVVIHVKRSSSGRQGNKPVAKVDRLSAVAGKVAKVNVLRNDSGVDTARITVTLVRQPRNGKASVDAKGLLNYRPKTGFSGTDTLRYRVVDAQGRKAEANVKINVYAKKGSGGGGSVSPPPTAGSTASTPTFSPNGGTHTDSVTVALKTVTSAATLYYTTDGTTPNTNSQYYGGPILLTKTTHLKAIAIADGYKNSTVASKSFTIATGSSGGSGYEPANPNASANGTALLDWVPPTTREDGSALTDLAGYRIYHGTRSGSYPSVIDVNASGITSYVVGNLAPGAHHFVVTAYDSANNQSDYSNVASKTIP